MGITISMDYCFMTTEGESETDPKVLVVHDRRLDAIWAFNVKAEGPSAEVVTWIIGKLKETHKQTANHTANDPKQTCATVTFTRTSGHSYDMGLHPFI